MYSARLGQYISAAAIVALVTALLFGGTAAAMGWLRWELAVIALLIASVPTAIWMVRRWASRAPPPSTPPPALDLNPARVEEADRLVREGQAALARRERALAYRYFSEAVERDFTNAAAWLGKSRTARSPVERRICLERARRIDLARGRRDDHQPRWDTPVAEQIARGLTLRDLVPLHGLTISPVNSDGAGNGQAHSGLGRQFKKWLEVRFLFKKA
jgi:hypothetical protein